MKVKNSPVKRGIRKKRLSRNRSISISDCESEFSPNDRSRKLEPVLALETRDAPERSENLEKELILTEEFEKNTSVNYNSENLTFSWKELTCDDEIFTLQCPKNFLKNNLLNKNVDFTMLKVIITSKGEAFKLQLMDSNQKFITLAVPKTASEGCMIKIPLKGHCVLQKIVDLPIEERTCEDIWENNTIMFPNDIKVRHPLLGTDWKAHVNIGKIAIKHYIKEEKIHKECKKAKRKNSEPEIVSHKKKRKEKLSSSKLNNM